jgi:hypothetical protein
MESWHDFWVALVGGSAALAGLLFVSISINLKEILATSELTDRAGVPLILLLGVLVSCSLLLVPGQSLLIVGSEILVWGLVIWGLVTYFDVRRLRTTKRPYRGGEPLRIALTQLASLPYVIAGILLIAGNESGLYWQVPAVVASFIKSFSDAGGLLVEINR